jgi:hypothetical protein
VVEDRYVLILALGDVVTGRETEMLNGLGILRGDRLLRCAPLTLWLEVVE